MKVFKKNLFLKFFSFLAAFTIWIYIIVILKLPVETTVKNVKVNFINEDIPKNSGVWFADEKDYKVDVKIRGTKTTLSMVTAKDIFASVNMASVTQSGKHELPININFSLDNISVTNKKPSMLQVQFDKLKEKKIKIRLNIVDEVNDYLTYDTKINPEFVTVRATEKTINKVNDAAIDVEFLNSTDVIDTKAKIKLFDEHSEEIITKLAIKDFESAEVFFRFGKSKEVKIVPDIKNKNIVFEEIIVIPSFLTVYGNSEVLEKIDKLYTRPVYIKGKSSEEEIIVDLAPIENIYIENKNKIELKIKNLKK